MLIQPKLLCLRPKHLRLIIGGCLLLCHVSGLLAQSGCGPDSTSFSWMDNFWDNGDLENIYRIPLEGMPDSIEVQMEIRSQAPGTFDDGGMMTPYLDGGGTGEFGSSLDLGVIFNPVSVGNMNALEPVVATLTFSEAVTCVEFEISDIDGVSGNADSIIVFANDSTVFPMIGIVSADPTVGASSPSAWALKGMSGPNLDGTSAAGQDAGTVQISFGGTLINSITIKYFDISGDNDPQGRGLGLWGNLVFSQNEVLPVELISYKLQKDENCRPLVQWTTASEYDLEAYVIEYSYDGYNYVLSRLVKPQNNSLGITTYEEVLDRKLNEFNYIRLSKIESDGGQDVIGLETISGRDCYNLNTVNIYPNPSYRDHFIVNINSTKDQNTDIVMIDQSGKLVMRQPYALKKGENWFRISSKSFAPGVYHLRFSTGQETISRKVSIL